MSTDIVPALNEQIQKSFKTRVMRDRHVARVSKRIRDGTAQFEDAHIYAERLGIDLSQALTDTMTEDALPNGRLYYNIARRTVVPALENNYNLVNDVAGEIQKITDQAAGIGLGAVRAEFPAERINGLIDKMTAEDAPVSSIITWLKEPIVNNSEAFLDDFVKENSKFQKDAGLKVKLVRVAEAKCCEWCSDLAGEYDYDSAPRDIYRRHEFCRCTVTFKSQKTSQNVWSKRKWTTPPEDIEKRQAAGQRQTMTTQERLSQLEQLERDRVVREFENETGYSRRSASETTRSKSPEEIRKQIEKIKERQERLRR